MESWQVLVFSLLILLLSRGGETQSWSGNVCSRVECRYVTRRVCAYSTWLGCCLYRTLSEPQVYTEYFCCQGWTHRNDRNCNIPICEPPCQNGGTCVGPGRCNCPVGRNGERCEGAVCSHAFPCYPGICEQPNNCRCSPGFTGSPDSRCMRLEKAVVKPQIYQMRGGLAQWEPQDDGVLMEKYSLLADSSEKQDTDFIWSNRRLFNRFTVMAAGQFSPSNLPPPPNYVRNPLFGVTNAFVTIQQTKLSISGNIRDARRLVLNKTESCSTPILNSPYAGIYNCTINPPFDMRLDTGDILKLTFHATGGGVRTLLDLNYGPNRVYKQDSFVGVSDSMAVEFRFDIDTLPKHPCLQTGSCTGDVFMLRTEDITKRPLTIQWKGWIDDESGMFRYAVEVFKLSRVVDGQLEIRNPLDPLFINETMETPEGSLQGYEQRYTPQDPGMYAIILEASDRANNSRYVRRLVLYDPVSSVTSDPQHPLHATTASPAANFTFQSSLSQVTVTWARHFLNKLHEEQSLLGAVREYPPQLEGLRKKILYNSQEEDREGSRTVDTIANARGIVRFDVAHKKDNVGGLNQPLEPSEEQWQQMGLGQQFTHPDSPNNGETFTVWVRAHDVLGNTRTERTQVTIDNTQPDARPVDFQMNVPVPGIDFSSTFRLTAEDRESGIAYVKWTFTRANGSVIYEEVVPGKQAKSCNDFRECYTTPRGQTFQFDQSFSVSNCHMMVEKENLATEEVTVSIEVTNAAGFVNRQTMKKKDLTALNGTEAYFPPQNVRIVQLTDTSVTLTWDFPPGCFARSEIWVTYLQDGQQVQRKVHKDARQLDLTALTPDQDYDVRLVTLYGQQRSDAGRFTLRTLDSSVSGSTVAGIIIGLLLLLLLLVVLVLFVLWRRGLAFQGDMAQRRINRLRSSFHWKKKQANFANDSIKMQRESQDQEELYLAPGQAWDTRPSWQIDAHRLTLLDQVAEGKFATIYKATLKSSDKTLTVAAKVLKSSFSEADSNKMMNKINFHATEVGRHENVLAMIGAVLDSTHLGPVMVLEFCEMGQLDAWLLKQNGKADEETMEKLYRFSRDIACGMNYLASKKITHERLAARNVLLTFFLDAKVAGFGPQHASDGQIRVPVKWAAPEVLEDKPATEKSDVWSFGITLWEIFSLGQQPYPDIRSTEIGTRLKSGYRMGKPEFADDMFYKLMTNCWEESPGKRKSFKFISDQLSAMFKPRERRSEDIYYATHPSP